MNYLFINSVYGVRSTGKLILAKCHELMEQGHTCYVAYGRKSVEDENVIQIRIGTKKDYVLHAALSRVLDMHGLGSKKATKAFLKKIGTLNLDYVWLHNIHGYYMNYEMLFAWLKRHPSIKVYWTLHDCWAFTGHCAYFTMAKCKMWKKGCRNCPQLSSYPKAIGFDHSDINYKKKKQSFCGVKDLTLITPSFWLAKLTKESFLREYPVEVIHNQIDKEVFKPTSGSLGKRKDLKRKKIVLGVAVGWEESKGYPDMMALRKVLDDSYVMVMVGLTKSQIKNLPDGIIGIEKTNNQKELAEIYTAADVFVNPTHQDNYPTVNLEAAACGTPVVTYNVGGSPESVPSENVVEENDIAKLAIRIREICQLKTVR